MMESTQREPIIVKEEKAVLAEVIAEVFEELKTLFAKKLELLLVRDRLRKADPVLSNLQSEIQSFDTILKLEFNFKNPYLRHWETWATRFLEKLIAQMNHFLMRYDEVLLSFDLEERIGKRLSPTQEMPKIDLTDTIRDEIAHTTNFLAKERPKPSTMTRQ